MRRIAHRGDRHAALLRLVDRHLHAELGRHVAEPAVAIDQRGDRRLLYDARLCLHVGPTLAAQPVVARDHRDAVAVDAVQIGPAEDVGGCLGILVRHAPGRQDGFKLGAVGLVRCGHVVSSGKTCWHLSS
jgi:hypothetical protein